MGRIAPANIFRQRAKLKFGLFQGSLDIYSQKELYSKYTKNEKSVEIIGISTARIVDLCYDSSGDKQDDLTATVFDTTTRADSARILLTNSTGATRYLTSVAIFGKRWLRFSDEDGFIHDSNVDYESIRKNGERKLEIGNNFICLKSQVEKIADYHYKFHRGQKHLYLLTETGTRHYYEVGEWYTLNLNITTVGIDELMNMKCRCVAVNIERGGDSLGMTEVILEEVEENWTFDANSVVRYLLSGNLSKLPTKEKIIVGASDYDGAADYYCDGTADEVEINKAIVHVKGTYGGGIVELTEGTFVTAAAILPLSNIVFQGRGWNTIIEKNGNYHGIDATGGSGTEILNVMLRDFKIQKDDSDTNVKDLIYSDYTINLLINNIWCYKPQTYGCVILHCENPRINNCLFSYSVAAGGLYVGSSHTNPSMTKINSCQATNNKTLGILVSNIEYSSINGNTCRDNEDHGIYIYTSNHNSIVGNICEGNGDGANKAGIFIEVSDNNIVSGNICEGNNSDGIHIQAVNCDRNVVTGNRSTGNVTNNFVDNGTNTTDSGNDWN